MRDFCWYIEQMLLVTSASLLVTSALLVVTMFAIRNNKYTLINKLLLLAQYCICLRDQLQRLACEYSKPLAS